MTSVAAQAGCLRGTVTETNWAGVIIKWDNRSQQAIQHNDMSQIERAPAK